MVTVFTTDTCPRCKVLKTKLQQKGIDFQECRDIDEILRRGIQSVPVLEVEGKLLDFSEALKYVNER